MLTNHVCDLLEKNADKNTRAIHILMSEAIQNVN